MLLLLLLLLFLLSSLSLKSGVGLIGFPSCSSLIPCHCRLHSPLIPTKSLFTQSSHLSLLLPSTPCTSAFFVNRSPSILSICPAYFSRLLTSFLGRLSLTPTSLGDSLSHQLLPSVPPFFTCLFLSLQQFFSHT